jgi:hypothetical protein
MRALLATALGLALGACASLPDRLPGPCAGADVCPTGQPPSGGGDGRRDGGLDVADAGDAGPAIVSLTGQLVVEQTVPPTGDVSGTRPGAMWRVEALSPVDPGAFAMTDATGGFALDRVRVVDGTVILRATAPVGMGPFGAINEFVPGGGRLTLLAVSSSAFERAAAGVGIAVGTELAHVVIEVVDTPATVSGISAVLTDGSTANTVYDDLTGALSSGIGATNSRGTIVLFNVSAPAAGRRLPVRLSRGMARVEYAIFVQPRHVTWARVPTL